MTIGTKSVLYGAHAFWLHPWFVALGWWKLYGFPFDLRLWVCFFVHDLGYLGKPNMDGPEGETHPVVGANIVRLLFGDRWGDFCLFHSRFYARLLNRRYTKLCVADKMATALTPTWIYLPMVIASGELNEYMSDECRERYKYEGLDYDNGRASWHKSVKRYLYQWSVDHSDADNV